jgi:hypothetical protein
VGEHFQKALGSYFVGIPERATETEDRAQFVWYIE